MTYMINKFTKALVDEFNYDPINDTITNIQHYLDVKGIFFTVELVDASGTNRIAPLFCENINKPLYTSVYMRTAKEVQQYRHRLAEAVPSDTNVRLRERKVQQFSSIIELSEFITGVYY